ncbi:sugar O-acetyltransferase [Flammeovirga sp. SJP92]|uniref:sugar O-acetyltransferase n=1 Tax=Flammeovirga sp. SJP92 TaxID=1775430 RepID=UPI00078928BC|nr:sugar O-acetyltransferase [Flammeovirga sp. SJP92]KXX66684.1 hypothetical protein AVL50_31065 [Flammeovirga sp. SJP92]
MKTEREKMLSGELYCFNDPELLKQRYEARLLCEEFNQLSITQQEEKVQLLQTLFGSVGEGIAIEPGFYCDYGFNIHCGKNVSMNFNCLILDSLKVTLEDGVMLGPGVHLIGDTHSTDPRTRPHLGRSGEITIKKNCWLGAGVTVMPGVTIGEGTTVGANSVVTKDLPPNVVAVGSPARVIKKLDY